MSHDIIIIGAGIAGLRIGIHLLRTYPHLRCTILEKYKHIGGRVDTYHDNLPEIGKVQWESGAGRISEAHHCTRALLHHYGLTLFPIQKNSLIIHENGSQEQDHFTEIYNAHIKPLAALSAHDLQTHTIYELLHKVAPPYVAELCYQFPYFSEIHTLRADHAICMLETEMSSQRTFYVCKEGLSALIEHMTRDFKKLGGVINTQHSVTSISYEDHMHTITCMHDKKPIAFTTPLCIMALPSEAVKKIQGVSHLPILNKVAMNPLLRIYAIFPVTRGKSWFSDLPKMITRDPIRFIIPVDASKGIIMISYTDGEEAEYWNNMTPARMKATVMKHIRALFPDKNIPNPIYLKPFHWKEGCSYWKTGVYDIVDESHASLHPDAATMPGLFLCGESFAVNQCWIESAVQQADKLAHHPAFIRACTSLK